jgi:hypothetical protein
VRVYETMVIATITEIRWDVGGYRTFGTFYSDELDHDYGYAMFASEVLVEVLW